MLNLKAYLIEKEGSYDLFEMSLLGRVVHGVLSRLWDVVLLRELSFLCAVFLCWPLLMRLGRVHQSVIYYRQRASSVTLSSDYRPHCVP